MHSELRFSSRLKILGVFFLLFFFVIFIRLFQLQVIQAKGFKAEAKAQHEKRSVLPARRGKILVRKNRLSEDTTPLATNNTLKKLFVDPLVLAYPKYNPKLSFAEQEKGDPYVAAKILAPVLIHSHCEIIEGCEIEEDIEKLSEIEQRAIHAYETELARIFTQTERQRVVILTEVSNTLQASIEELRFAGLRVDEARNLVVDPTQVVNHSEMIDALHELINVEKASLKTLVNRRPVRYREITNKIVPEVAERIVELKSNPDYKWILRGVRMVDEHWRYYPEKGLAAQIIGFVNSKGDGQYGIEKRFDLELRGKTGQIFGAINTRGQRILGKSSTISRARDGADVLLTIDRVIQGNIEKILEEETKRYDADFGQVLVMEPQSGKILALAQSPGFDPNRFGEVYSRYEITPEQESADREDPLFNQKIPTVVEQSRFYRYFNTWGPAAFTNKQISEIYEPGSVIKALTMALALNSDEVTPQTTFDDDGPIEVDEYRIRNSDDIYAGPTTMLSVLNRSLNTGIAFIARKMGREALYEGLVQFGFGQYTDIELDGELTGKLESWKDWSESELITRGYGQGMSSTPLQTLTAFSVLANGGYLMKPLLVEEVRYSDGRVEKMQTEKIRRIISDQTYHQVKSMLKNGVDNGIAKGARVWGHSVMGKTGTSQTYDSSGQLRTGEGTTITSFAGFGPLSDPQFVILVKYDYPKVSQWGSETAAVTFSKVAEFLFQYYGIPPDI